MSDHRHDSDLDWLYRRNQEPDRTRGGYPSSPQQDPSPYPPYPSSPRQEPSPYPPYRPEPSPYPPQQQSPWQESSSHLGSAAAQDAGQPIHPEQAMPQQPSRGVSQTPPPSRPPRTRGPKRRHPIRRLVLVLVLAWVAFMVGTPIYAWTIGTKVDTNPGGDRPAEQPGTAVLLVGSDGREKLTEQQRGELGTGDTEGQRTDSMMLLYKPPSGKSAMISLPRDSWVDVPGHGKAKLNAAYAWGGAPLLIQTIETNTGIRIDGYLEVGFLGVVEAVDAVGGIEVCPEKAISDRDAHLELPAGCQNINGKTALGYVRMRKSDQTGDIGRMMRQREVIGKVAKKALNPLTLLNPVSYWNLNMAAAHTLGRGSETGFGEVLGGVGVFLSSATGSGYSLSVPVSDANASRNGQSVMLWDKNASQEVFNAVLEGNTEPLAKYSH